MASNLRAIAFRTCGVDEAGVWDGYRVHPVHPVPKKSARQPELLLSWGSWAVDLKSQEPFSSSKLGTTCEIPRLLKELNMPGAVCPSCFLFGSEREEKELETVTSSVEWLCKDKMMNPCPPQSKETKQS